MTFNISQFKGAFKYGGLRTSMFEVQIFNPATAIGDILSKFRVSAAALPESTLNANDVNYFGRVVKVAGSRTYADWNVTAYEDEDYTFRDSLETWAASINSPETNLRVFATSEMEEYKADAYITAYSQTGQLLKRYKFIGLFPTSVGSIEMGWEGNNVASFQTTFAYDYFLPDDSVNTIASSEASTVV